MLRVLGNILVKVKSQVLNFLVNASPPKPFDVVNSNAVCVHRSHDVEGTGQHFV